MAESLIAPAFSGSLEKNSFVCIYKETILLYIYAYKLLYSSQCSFLIAMQTKFYKLNSCMYFWLGFSFS